MNAASWDVADFESDDPSAPGRPPALVSLHFLRAALRRRRVACLLSALLGALAGGLFLLVVPAPHEARTTLFLGHDPQVDPSRAMATDVGLVTTRTVAERAVKQLALPMAAEDLVQTVTVTPTTSDLLEVRMTADGDVEAVRVLRVFTSHYLDFRAAQLSAQSNALVDGIEERIDALQIQVEASTRRIAELTSGGDVNAGRVSDAITQRAKLSSDIGTFQQSVQDIQLRTSAALTSSRVIDSAAVEPGGTRRHLVLVLASGLIGGTALGVGLVLFSSVTSDRLRRRVDVATALGAPVPLSVGRISPLPRLIRRLPLFEAREARRADDRQRLAHVIESALPVAGVEQWLAVACVDNAQEARFALVAAATELQRRGRDVNLVDLSEEGCLDAAVAAGPATDGSGQLTLSRPRGIPSLVRDETDIETLGPRSARIAALSPAGVCLVLADLNPSVGADHLTAWTERVVVAVTAGKSSAERVRTAGDLVRAAGLDLLCAVLIRSESVDESSGAVSPAARADTGPDERP